MLIWAAARHSPCLRCFTQSDAQFLVMVEREAEAITEPHRLGAPLFMPEI